MDEPQRLDLQCLLIQVYRQSGKPEEAVNYCAASAGETARLPGSQPGPGPGKHSPDQAGRTNTARRRLEALDPYYAGLSPDELDPRLVPDAYIQFERPGL